MIDNSNKYEVSKIMIAEIRKNFDVCFEEALDLCIYMCWNDMHVNRKAPTD